VRLVGYVLLMPGMDQTHGEASIGQHLKHGNPQHPGGFQGYGVDFARLPPVRQGPDAVGERRKAADRLGIPIRLPTTPYRFDPRRMRPPYRQLGPKPQTRPNHADGLFWLAMNRKEEQLVLAAAETKTILTKVNATQFTQKPKISGSQGSRLSLGLLGPAMPLGSRFARYFDACLVGALFCTCLDARVVFDWQSAKPEVRPKLTRTTLP